MNQVFKTPYSRYTLILTIVCMIVMHAGFMFSLNRMRLAETRTMMVVWGAFFLLLTGIVLFCFAIQVKRITLTDTDLVIHRPVGAKRIPLASVIAVSRKETLKSDIRLFGIGGLFGFYGLFLDKNGTRYHAYIKDHLRLVRIVTPQRQYVLSCESPDDLVSSLADRLRFDRG